MSQTARRRQRKPKPQPAGSALGSLPGGWNWYAGGALRGCGLLRESQRIWAWDDTNTLYLFDAAGQILAKRRPPKPVVGVAAPDAAGGLVAISGAGQLWWLDEDLKPILEINTGMAPAGVGVDPHGRYALVSGKEGVNFLCDANGRKLRDFRTPQPLRHIRFVPTYESIVAAGAAQSLCSVSFDGEIEWRTAVAATVGGLAIDGNGEMILLSCYGYGLIRYDVDGRKEGAYRLDVTPERVATDIRGSDILVSSLEGTLTLLHYDGQVKNHRKIPSRAVGLEMDAVGRFGVLGLDTGELRMFLVPDWFDEQPAPLDGGTGVPEATGQVAAAQPTWEARLFGSIDEAKSAVLDAVPGKGHLAVFSNRKTLRIFDGQGQLRHETRAFRGHGRIVRAAADWLAAASDTQVAAYDPAVNESVQSEATFADLSHLVPTGRFGRVVLVENRQFARLIDLPGNTRWERRFEDGVESLAVAPDGAAAFTTDEHELLVLDAAGQRLGGWRPTVARPMQVVACPGGWVTAVRDAQAVRGHEIDGSLLWSVDTPWRPWSLRRLGPYTLVTSVEGDALALDADGRTVAQSTDARDDADYFLWHGRTPARLYAAGRVLLAGALDGTILWRMPDEHETIQRHADAAGLWKLHRRQVSFYAFGKG